MQMELRERDTDGGGVGEVGLLKVLAVSATVDCVLCDVTHRDAVSGCVEEHCCVDRVCRRVRKSVGGANAVYL